MPYTERALMYQMSVAAPAFALIPTADQDKAIDAASREADGSLTRQFTLPLLQWGDDLRQAVSDIAAYRLLRARGFNPSKGGSDSDQLRLGYTDAQKWLARVADGAIKPIGIVDSSPTGANNTDPAGEQRIQASVLAPRTTQCAGDSFWDSSDGCSVGGIGPPKPRGW